MSDDDIQALIQGLRETSRPERRREFLDRLLDFRTAEVLEVALEMVRESDVQVRAGACQVLGNFNDPRAIAALREAASDPLLARVAQGALGHRGRIEAGSGPVQRSTSASLAPAPRTRQAQKRLGLHEVDVLVDVVLPGAVVGLLFGLARFFAPSPNGLHRGLGLATFVALLLLKPGPGPRTIQVWAAFWGTLLVMSLATYFAAGLVARP